MGDRYTLEVKCPKCGFFDDDVYYAPTCGFLIWVCPECDTEVDLEEYSGVDALSCANTTYGKDFIEGEKRHNGKGRL